MSCAGGVFGLWSFVILRVSRGIDQYVHKGDRLHELTCGYEDSGCTDLIRMYPAPGAKVFLVAWEIPAIGGLHPVPQVLPWFLTFFCILS